MTDPSEQQKLAIRRPCSVHRPMERSANRKWCDAVHAFQVLRKDNYTTISACGCREDTPQYFGFISGYVFVAICHCNLIYLIVSMQIVISLLRVFVVFPIRLAGTLLAPSQKTSRVTCSGHPLATRLVWLKIKIVDYLIRIPSFVLH